MNVSCSADVCPVILDSTCVFYSGGNLFYTGINTNDNLQTIIIKLNNKFKDAGLGYAFNNGLTQVLPGDVVQLGGTLVQNTTINNGGFTFTFTQGVEAASFITTAGTSSQFVKGDGSLDGTSYQPLGNYITDLTGDGTASGPGSAVFTLSNTGVIANSYGSSSQIPVITVNAKGRITNVTTTAINYPAQLLLISGDVTGSGYIGTTIALTLNSVNSNTYSTIAPLKFSVNDKGLVTAASLLTNFDLDTIYGYTPVPPSRTLTINGVTYDLSANRTWNIVSSLTGSGTQDYIPKWSSPTSIGDSIIYDSGTNIGIGTATPGGKLTIQSGNSYYPLEIRTSSYGGANRGGFEFDGVGNLELALQKTTGVENVRLRSDGDTFFNGGNFGINTTTPLYKLDVNGSFHTTGQNTLDDLAGTGTRMVVTDSSGVLSAQTIPTGSGSRSINSVSIDTTAGSAADTDYVYLVSGNTTITLPSPASNTNLYTVKRVGTGVVSIATTSGLIDGSSSPITINVQYVSLDFISDGTDWFII